nr:3-hydroxyacyl-[acyl-carrier-protein] dehydratase FabZ [Tanacetum cinerariifolium]
MASSTLANSLISPPLSSHSHISNRTTTPLRLPFPRINRSPLLSLKTTTTHLVKCSGDDATAPKDETPIELRYPKKTHYTQNPSDIKHGNHR